ncbi:MAG: hypothetical protein PHO32_10580, partial [Candidatus Cloacimonetes bacterium]|nr:hypothetical protein [Candidatus Cloacimonadota bacterium]
MDYSNIYRGYRMYRIIFITLMILSATMLNALPDIRIEVETGMAIPGYNDVRIPNVGRNTMFSLKDDLDISPVLHTRLSLHYYLTSHHQLSLMASPLTLKPEGRLKQDVVFQEVTFLENTPTKAIYRFDSYRFQYRYNFSKEFFGIRAVGASVKLRDAEISLDNGIRKESKTNTGFVPLLSLNAGHRISEKVDLILEAEGLASPYGRAEDVFLGATYQVKDKLIVKSGYRLLEGGS